MLKSWRLWVSLTDPWQCHILPTPACLFKWWSSLFIPQTIVGTLIPALVVLLSSYSHTWATGSWWIPLCLCLQEHHGSPQGSQHLPISVLSLDLTDTLERTKLCSSSPMLQGKGERTDHLFLPFCLSLHQLLADLGHSWLTHMGYMCWTCASDTPHLVCGLT